MKRDAAWKFIQRDRRVRSGCHLDGLAKCIQLRKGPVLQKGIAILLAGGGKL